MSHERVGVSPLCNMRLAMRSLRASRAAARLSRAASLSRALISEISCNDLSVVICTGTFKEILGALRMVVLVLLSGWYDTPMSMTYVRDVKQEWNVGK